MSDNAFPFTCCTPEQYLSWAFVGPRDAPITYPIGPMSFCEDCDPLWAKTKGASCHRREAVVGQFDTPLSAWLKTQLSKKVADAVVFTQLPQRDRIVEELPTDYRSMTTVAILRAWAASHGNEVVIFDLCKSLAALGVYESRELANGTISPALYQSRPEFQRVRRGVFSWGGAH